MLLGSDWPAWACGTSGDDSKLLKRPSCWPKPVSSSITMSNQSLVVFSVTSAVRTILQQEPQPRKKRHEQKLARKHNVRGSHEVLETQDLLGGLCALGLSLNCDWSISDSMGFQKQGLMFSFCFEQHFKVQKSIVVSCVANTGLTDDNIRRHASNLPEE